MTERPHQEQPLGPRSNDTPQRGLSLNPYDALEQRFDIRSPEQLHRRCEELGRGKYVIDGLIPHLSLGILVGDSGLGKSPLAYQASLCVATGTPFLGRQVTKGRVLYFDFENGLEESLALIDNLVSFLGLEKRPGAFRVWHFGDSNPAYGRVGQRLEDIIHAVSPSLVIIDSLASCYPEIEERNSKAVRTLAKLRTVIHNCKTSILCIHHIRKPSTGKDKPKPLQDENARRWLNQTRGASALINATDVRLGLDLPSIPHYRGRSDGQSVELALILKGFARLRGDIGPYFVERVFDSNGEALGYGEIVGTGLLFNPEQEACFQRLPRSFQFKQAKQFYGRADQATSDFLGKCTGLGLLKKIRRGLYEKSRETE